MRWVTGPIGYFSGRSTSAERMKLFLQVGASARERLKAAAAARWKVPVAEVAAKDSVLTHTASGRSMLLWRYRRHAAAIKLVVEPAPKLQTEWTFLGKASPAQAQHPGHRPTAA